MLDSYNLDNQVSKKCVDKPLVQDKSIKEEWEKNMSNMMLCGKWTWHLNICLRNSPQKGLRTSELDHFMVQVALEIPGLGIWGPLKGKKSQIIRKKMYFHPKNCEFAIYECNPCEVNLHPRHVNTNWKVKSPGSILDEVLVNDEITRVLECLRSKVIGKGNLNKKYINTD